MHSIVIAGIIITEIADVTITSRREVTLTEIIMKVTFTGQLLFYILNNFLFLRYLSECM